MDHTAHSYMPLLSLLFGAIGWPSLIFILCRYEFRAGDQWTLRWTILCFGIAGLVAMWTGDNILAFERSGRSAARFYLIRDVICALPYLALIIWFAIRAFCRLRHEQSSRSI
jgi:hypothetical protein